MHAISIVNRIRGAASRFVRADRGNVAVIFAIALVPLISFVGAAIDYSRANRARSTMQAAMDSTALMLSRDLSTGAITPSQVPTKAQTYFNALYTDRESQPTVTATYNATTASGSSVVMTGTGSIQTAFMKVVGFPTMSFNASSTTTWGNGRLRVAMALDNTGSMASDGKIAALRTAGNNLIDQLSALSKTNGDVYISVIPFAKVVNAGSSNSGQSWIDWTDWLNPPTTQPNNGSTQASLPMNWHAVGPGAKCPWTNGSGGFTCTTSPTSLSGASYIPSSGTYSGYICPGVDYNSHTRYNGCWVSTAAGTGVFCTGSSSCACPLNSSGSSVSGCSCTTTGGVKSCTGNLYTHDWTQPGPNDPTHNSDQPRVSAVVGFTNNKWTSTTQTPTVLNNWQQASTNPIGNWTGCITDRTQPNDTTGVSPGSSDVTTLFPANEYYENSSYYCSNSASPQLEPIIPMSYAWSTLKTAITAMQPTGGTNQAVGLAWAWQTLLQTGPAPAPAEDPNYAYNRIIILLSDGLNTEDRWPDYGDGSSQNGGQIDARQQLLCNNIKNARDANNKLMYTIYTIQVNTSSPADPTSSVLQNCASSTDKFFMLTNANQIVTTFNTIGTQLSQLRVAQ